MSLLKEAILTLREPLVEGRGIKVFLIETDELTDAHIEKLRKEYNKVDKVDPENPGYKKLTKFLDAQSQKRLKQLAGAKIKFVSSLARNRMVTENYGLLSDMMDDLSVQTLVQDIRRALHRGVPLDNIEANIEAYEDEASTQLTPDERATLFQSFKREQLKHEEEEQKLTTYDHDEFADTRNQPVSTEERRRAREKHEDKIFKNNPRGHDAYARIISTSDEEEEKKTTLRKPRYSRKERLKRREKMYQSNRKGLPQTFDVANKPWRPGHR